MQVHVTVAEVAAAVDGLVIPHTGGTTVLSGITHDSRAVTPGDLFCCVPGATTDGHDHAPAAVAAGAAAVLCERDLGLAVPQIVVPAVRPTLGPAASVVFDEPAASLTMIGVTGTNGKTTTTYLLRNIFEAARRRTGVLGTLSGARTTPEAPDLQRWLAARRDEGVDVVVMEVSSHALDQHRVDGCRYDVAAFTNLSQDHLDYHGTMEAYFRAKAELFTPERAERGVVCVDDVWGRRLADATTIPVVEVSVAMAAELDERIDRCRFRWRGRTTTVHLGGRHNVANALVAAEVAVLAGVDPDTVVAGLDAPVAVPGRLELVDAGQPFAVVVDFAHTPDALAQVLHAASVGTTGRVTVVFGCGGDRDPGKRVPMGRVAAEGADRVVLTADNSRGEPTEVIIAAVRSGFDDTHPRRATELVVQPDRRAAIETALTGAEPGDVVVIAGKGHETTQTIGDVVTPFDDRVVAHEVLAATGGAGEVRR